MDYLDLQQERHQKKWNARRYNANCQHKSLHCPCQGPALIIKGENPVFLTFPRQGAQGWKFETVLHSSAEELGHQVPWKLQRRRCGIICGLRTLLPTLKPTKPEIKGNKAGLFSFCLFYFLIHCTPAWKSSLWFHFQCGRWQNAKDGALWWNQNM